MASLPGGFNSLYSGELTLEANEDCLPTLLGNDVLLLECTGLQS